MQTELLGEDLNNGTKHSTVSSSSFDSEQQLQSKSRHNIIHNLDLHRANKITIATKIVSESQLPFYQRRSSHVLRNASHEMEGLKAKLEKRRRTYLEEAPVEEGIMRASDLRYAAPAGLLRPVLVLGEALPPVSRHLRPHQLRDQTVDSLSLTALLFSSSIGEDDQFLEHRSRRDQSRNMPSSPCGGGVELLLEISTRSIV